MKKGLLRVVKLVLSAHRPKHLLENQSRQLSCACSLFCEKRSEPKHLGKRDPNWGSKKTAKRFSDYLLMMADPEIEAVLSPLRKHVKEQVS